VVQRSARAHRLGSSASGHRVAPGRRRRSTRTRGDRFRTRCPDSARRNLPGDLLLAVYVDPTEALTTGCSFAFHLVEGIPPWPAYELTPFANPSVAILAPGPMPIYYRRVVARPGQAPSLGSLEIGGPTTADRLKYLAALANVDVEMLPLQSRESHSVAAPGRTPIEAESARIRQDIGAGRTALLRRLVNARALTPDRGQRGASTRDRDHRLRPPPPSTLS
jgi:hypothetical protein